MSAAIRRAREDDFRAVAAFVATCPPLEAYPQHVYRILLRTAGPCFVAEAEGRIVGWVAGLARHDRPETWFLWQIGVVPEMQGRGLGGRLLEAVEAALREAGLRRIELTIDPENDPSRRLFEKAAYANAGDEEGPTVDAAGRPAVPDFYGPGRHFMLYAKWL